MKIAVGCGKRYYGEEWTHIDGNTSFEHVKHHDIINLPCEDNTADIIYACHVLEYFDQEEADYVLKRWYDKLKPGGILMVAVPSFHTMIELYYHRKVKLPDILGPLYGKWTMNGKSIYHKTVYDYVTLREKLLRTGFESADLYNWRETEIAEIDDHSQAYMNPKGDKENGVLVSLNMQAIK